MAIPNVSADDHAGASASARGDAAPDAIGGQPLAEFALERFTPGTYGAKSAYEHWLRYVFALSWLSGREVLDYGCGTGFGSQLIAGVATDVLALDVSPGAIAYAREHHPHARCRFERCGELPVDVPGGSRDAIIAFEVIEHLNGQDELLREFARILRPGGVLLVSTPDPRYTATLGENPYHVHELNRAELVALVQRHFAHWRVFVQTTVIGAGALPERRAAGDGRPDLHVLGWDADTNRWTVVEDAAGASEAWVVAASDAPLPPSGGCIVADRDGRLLEELRAYARDLERGLSAELANERAARVAAEGAVAAERTRADRAARDVEAAGASLAETQAELAGTREALRLSEADCRRLQADVAALERRVGWRWAVWAARRLVGRERSRP